LLIPYQPILTVLPIHVIAKDYESYLSEYGFPLLEQLAEFGAEVLAADANINVLEGSCPGNWVAIIKFPSAEIMSDFYSSNKYAPLKALRVEKLSNEGTVVVVPGIGNGE
jgi:uncharacterized protein (DUF1330 family)